MGASRSVSDGDTHYLSWGDFLSGDTAFTLMFWAKRTGSLDLDGLFNLRQAPGDGGGLCIGYLWTGGNGMIVQMHHAIESSSSSSATDLSAAIDSSVWNHFTITWDGAASRAKIYINGADRSNNAGVGVDAANTSDGLQLGQAFGGFNTAINFAHVEFHNVEFTANEVLESVYRPSSIQRGLMLYNPIYGIVSPEPDESGNGRTATINGTCAESADGPPVSLGTALIRPVRASAAAPPAGGFRSRIAGGFVVAGVLLAFLLGVL